LGEVYQHPPPSKVEVKERVKLYLYSPFWNFVPCSWVKFTNIQQHLVRRLKKE
jgi:hypothetical protein